MTIIENLATVKKRLSQFIDDVHSTHERIIITRNGRPAAVLISPEDLESMEETLSILADPATVAAIREGEADADAARVHDWAVVEQDRAHQQAG